MVVSLIDYVGIELYWIIYGFVVILGAVLVIGDKVNGATRWIDQDSLPFSRQLCKIFDPVLCHLS